MKNIALSFLKGILAGLSIGLGGFLFILLSHYVPGEIGKILGSLFFAVGLFLVCTFKFSLFTGKIGLIYEKKQEKDFYISLPVMLIGNAVGAFLLGYICYFSFRNIDLINTAINAAKSRTNLFTVDDYFALILRSILCGLCVYLAVKAFNMDRLKPLGIILLVLFVFIFVYSGFQHCIANMFYFGFANEINGYTFINLALCIVGNSIGPVFGVLLYKVFNR